MAMGTRQIEQSSFWVATSELPKSPGHPFYARLNVLLDTHDFDRFVEHRCEAFYAPVMGRPSLPPGLYFRLLLVGYFEGIDSERGIAWRATDSLAVRSFLRLPLDEAPPDHSTISRTRRVIDLETHRAVFTWVQQRLVEAGLLKGQTVASDATTLEANAAMRSIVRRDTGESYQAFHWSREGVGDRDADARSLGASGSEAEEEDVEQGLDEPSRSRCEGHEDERRPDASSPQSRACGRPGDRRHCRRHSAGRRRRRHHDDRRDRDHRAKQVEDAQVDVDEPQTLDEIIGDKGYHSNQTMVDLEAVGIRSYISEPDRGRRDWSEEPEAQAPVYANRRRLRGRRGRRLMRQRGERIERTFAHLYDTGGMRCTHLRGHQNLLKRVLIHAGGFNLGLVMRHLIGIGTPRGLQGRLAAIIATLWVLMRAVRRHLAAIAASHRLLAAMRGRLASPVTLVVNSSAALTCATGC